MPSTRTALENAGDSNKPKDLRKRAVERAKLFVDRKSYLLSSLIGVVGDLLPAGTIPAGGRYVGHRVTSSVSLGTSTLAFGDGTTAAKYAAAATFTGVDTPVSTGKAAEIAADPVSADVTTYATVAVADLPTTASKYLVLEVLYTR